MSYQPRAHSSKAVHFFTADGTDKADEIMVQYTRNSSELWLEPHAIHVLFGTDWVFLFVLSKEIIE